MVDPFPTVLRVEEDGSSAVVGMLTRSEQLERRRDKANRIRFLMENGVPVATIADDMGISRVRVYQLRAYADLTDKLEPVSVPEPEPQTPVPTNGRPLWSYPDDETLALCREIKAEMEAAQAAGRRF